MVGVNRRKEHKAANRPGRKLVENIMLDSEQVSLPVVLDSSKDTIGNKKKQEKPLLICRRAASE